MFSVITLVGKTLAHCPPEHHREDRIRIPWQWAALQSLAAPPDRQTAVVIFLPRALHATTTNTNLAHGFAAQRQVWAFSQITSFTFKNTSCAKRRRSIWGESNGKSQTSSDECCKYSIQADADHSVLVKVWYGLQA